MCYKCVILYRVGRKEMSKTDSIHVRIDAALKRTAEKILNDLGLSHSQTIAMFYKQIIFCNGLPFDVKIPNNETHESVVMNDITRQRLVRK